jgi:hypothetical protein
MPYPLSENFASGIPAGFAQVGGAGTGFSATYNATEQTADLVFDANNSFWHMLQADFATDFWFEYDVELVAKSITDWNFGIYLYSNTASSATGNYEGHRQRIVQYSSPNHSWVMSSITNANVVYNTATASAQFYENWMAIGARQVLRFDVRKFPQATGDTGHAWHVRASRNGVPVVEHLRYDLASLRPAIHGWGITMRIHSVAGNIGSALAEPVTGAFVPNSDDLLRMRGGERGDPTYTALPLTAASFRTLYSGHGRIVGTVKRRGDIPWARRVSLIDEVTRYTIAETWSDPVTGAYSFEQVDINRKYTIISYDHTGEFGAVIANGIQAVPFYGPLN